MGAVLVGGTAPGHTWTNTCTGEGLPPAGDEVGVDIGPGLAFVGIDTETSRWPNDPALGVCVNDETYGVTVTTTGGDPYVFVNHCTSAVCSPAVDNTGVFARGSTTTAVGSTTVCAGVCTSVPFGVLVDTGYDIDVDGGALLADACLAVGAVC